MASSARKAEKVVVDRDVRVRELARVSLEAAIAQVRGNERAARTGRDPEATHQLRVGVRRLRVILRLFAKHLGASATARLQTSLRWVFQRLGAVRDYDVLIENAAAPPSVEGSEALRDALIHERDKAARAAIRALQSERYTKLVRALRQLAIDAGDVDGVSPRARKWLAKRLDKRRRAVLSRVDALSGDDEPALHALRKELKKLRYTADLAHGLYRDERTARYLKRLSKLQDGLGPVNDASVGRRLLEPLAHHRDADLVAAAGALARSLDDGAARNLKKLPRAFAKLERAKPFWD